MRISDWSSDVCSSELGVGVHHRLDHADIAVIAAFGLVAMLAFEDQLVRGDRPLQRVRITPQDKRVLIAQHNVRRREASHAGPKHAHDADRRSEEHTSELQSLMRISYAVFCLKK